MPPSSPPEQPQPPHPLAVALCEQLRDRPGARTIDFATGGGRNAAALRAAGFEVLAVSDAEAASNRPFAAAEGRYAGVLSTHGFLHGTPAEIAARVAAAAQRLDPGGLFYATFGSKRDARFGTGIEIARDCYAAREGDERGVPHGFFDDEGLRDMLAALFEIESLRETPAAHGVHWIAIARRR
jgi:hypothetical protein